MKGFDGCFILQYVFQNVSRWKPEVIRTGTKLITIRCGKSITFLDSLNFIQLPLSKFPEAFKFEESKGFFPHFFNTNDNFNYIGPIPDKHYYGCDTMKTKERADFLTWHREQLANNYVFNLKDEILKYCILDVNILRKGCLKFRECFLKINNNVDPFLESLTIASACNLVFRRNFLKSETIGIIPKNGYRCSDNQSKIAITWLSWLMQTENINISHAGNGREVRLNGSLLVDGFCQETNTVFEFYGCWWHGCEKCFFNQTSNLNNKHDALFLRRENTFAIEEKIRKLGCNIRTIWECTFRNDIKDNPDLNRFVNEHNLESFTPLNPRDCFFGGRTNVCKLYYKCKDNEKIKYYDVCSLYPFINKYGKYPIGHPKKIYVGNDCLNIDITTFEGVIKCIVMPPQHLYHPVLPYRYKGKLTFPLCKTCVEISNQYDCGHKPEERQFTGTYVADELRKAVELGYVITLLLEAWEYNVVQYNKETNTKGLFTDYVNRFLKMKQEYSGWLSWCDSEDKKQLYLTQYFEKEGIVLDAENISENSGMRFISKIMLNSFWGKFGQRENPQKTEIIDDARTLFDLLTNHSRITHNLTIVNNDVLLANWDSVCEDIIPLKTVNVIIAAYTTAGARLELYKYLEKLDRRVLYFDTDSVIFTQKEDEWQPEIGDSYISEFVSGGPKNYAYRYWVTKERLFKTVCKVKGITLHYKNEKLLN
nr:PREDICTED: probable DNA polymerase [Tribolium castaneum]|eukprot:XP_015834829.1 PREDICTED: probable DNA polymerase [Tribolium castaneum]